MKIGNVNYIIDGNEPTTTEAMRIRKAHNIARLEGFADLEEYRACYEFKTVSEVVDYMH